MKALRDKVSGQVILAGEPDYDAARRVWNGSIDRRPAAIVRCADVADVVASVRFARERGLLIAVRGGGHNVAGTGTCDDGIVIDLGPMKGVSLNGQTANVQPGLLWRDLDAATQAAGLAVTGGIVSTTGVAGFTLGGGIGWLHRKIGLTVDNLLSAEVVTADGRIVHTDDDLDLLWGLRGGGGNFGIVTDFGFRLHPVGPQVMAGLVFFEDRHLVRVITGYRDMMLAAPDELTLFLILRKAPPAPFLPPEVHGRPVIAVAGMYAGPLDEGARALAPLPELAPPVANLMQPRAYTQFQSMLDGSWAEGFGNYWKAEYVTGIPDDALPILAEYLDGITSPLSDFKFAALGGAAGRVPADASAFSHRTAPFVLNINSRWALPGDGEPHTAWARKLWEAMQPFSAGGSYVNFLGNEGADRVRSAYGEPAYQRLVDLKRRYDPENSFRLNQNIPPGA